MISLHKSSRLWISSLEVFGKRVRQWYAKAAGSMHAGMLLLTAWNHANCSRWRAGVQCHNQAIHAEFSFSLQFLCNFYVF